MSKQKAGRQCSVRRAGPVKFRVASINFAIPLPRRRTTQGELVPGNSCRGRRAVGTTKLGQRTRGIFGGGAPFLGR